MYCVTSLFFFFKKETAYEMRISDWSSYVFSSVLPDASWLRHTANIVGEGPKLVSRDDEVERDQKIFAVEECLCIVACSLEEAVIFDSLTRGNGRLLEGCRKNLLQAGDRKSTRLNSSH